jgi:ketosteroid isomerase-like protein
VAQGNREIVRGGYLAAFGGEEWRARTEAWVAPDFELDDRTLPEVARGLKGPAAMRAEADYMLDAFEDVRYELEELRELGDRVLARVRASGRGKGSGMRIDGTLGHIWTMRDGQAVRLEIYGSWDEALQAAGPTAAGS